MLIRSELFPVSDLNFCTKLCGGHAPRSGLRAVYLCHQPDIRFSSLRRNSMSKLGRSKTIRCLVFGVLVLAATSCAQKRSSVPQETAAKTYDAEQIAKAYGLDSFE